jgi:hypothetical protein
MVHWPPCIRRLQAHHAALRSSSHIGATAPAVAEPPCSIPRRRRGRGRIPQSQLGAAVGEAQLRDAAVCDSSWDDSGSRLVVDAGSIVQSAVCPCCTCSSSRPHGRYQRWVADCPSFGQPVTLAVEVRRFKCVNPGCTRQTFTERIETLVAAGQRRTLRLVETVRSLGYALGGEAAARLAARLGVRISGPTVLRDLRRGGCPPPATVPVVIGIDDWALARGHRYGTIVVDLEKRRPIELLAERDAATVVAWLKEQPAVRSLPVTEPALTPTRRAPLHPMHSRWLTAGTYWPTCATPSSGCCCAARES